MYHTVLYYNKWCYVIRAQPGLVGPDVVHLGRHYLSNVTSLIRPHLFYACFVESRTTTICYGVNHHFRRKPVLDKKCYTSGSLSLSLSLSIHIYIYREREREREIFINTVTPCPFYISSTFSPFFLSPCSPRRGRSWRAGPRGRAGSCSGRRSPNNNNNTNTNTNHSTKLLLLIIIITIMITTN